MLAICIMLNQFRLNAVHMYALCLETAAPVGPGSMSSLLTQDFNSVQPQQKEINQSINKNTLKSLVSIFVYCMSEKSWPILNSQLLYKMAQFVKKQ